MVNLKGQGDVWFDKVVMAAHADQSLALIDDASPLERELLGAFGFQRNHAVLHSDASLMPKRRGAWAAWNYVSEAAAPASHGGGWQFWARRIVPPKRSMPDLLDEPVAVN